MGQRAWTLASRRDDILPEGARRRTRRRGTSLSVVAMAVVLVTVAVADFDGSEASTSAGQFLVQCLGPVMSKAIDPMTGAASHNHEFYGSRAIGVTATHRDLRDAPSACAAPAHTGDEPGDTASYWAPTLYVSGVRLPVPKSTFYYTGAGKRPPLTAWPAGLKVLAGDSKATQPQPTSAVYWGCGDGSSVSKVTSPPQCRSGDTGLTVHVIFPDCWNGRDLDSPDHRSHLAYSRSGACPAGYPVSLPKLIARFQWTNAGPNPATLSLSSGSVYTYHADFWNAWHQIRLVQLVDYCINGGRKCTYDDMDALPQP